MSNLLKKNGILIGFLIAINIVAAYLYFRIDLTEDKRYSLSDATENMLKNLTDQVVIKVYLDGENLPGGFERLKRAINETLEEFKIEGGKNIDYQFVNPYDGTDDQRNKLFKELVAKGMQPTNIFDKKNGKKTENLIFPYATVFYDGKESTVLLLNGNQAENAQVKLNQSFENVEYQLASTIQQMTNKNKKKIGLLTEFTNLRPVNFAGLITTLQENYELYIIDSKTSPTFVGVDAIILPKPDKMIDDSTKFKIDQFIMHGGKAMFFVDGLKIDSIGLEGTFAQPLNVNLDDMFFNYGLRINKNIVKDGLNAAIIPLVVGNVGDKPEIQPMPYRYFPLINNFGKSLITKNIDMVYTKFSADIDEVNKNDGVVKTPLLLTSQYTKVLDAPALITYNEARTETEEKTYNQGEKVIGYLLEGEFKSLFANQIGNKNLVAKSKPTKLVICADGDMIVNDVDRITGNPMPLGFDKFTQHIFGNQDFVKNSLNYLLDESGIISAKSKSVGLRPLDSLKIKNDRLEWQLINIVLPILVLVAAGIVRYRRIKNRYGKA